MTWYNVKKYDPTWQKGMGQIHLELSSLEGEISGRELKNIKHDDFFGYLSVLQGLKEGKTVWYEENQDILKQSNDTPEPKPPKKRTINYKGSPAGVEAPKP